MTQLVNQQTALRQVTELAARDAPVDEVLHAVAVQASHLAHVDFTALLRYEPDGSVEVVALSGALADLAVGVRVLTGLDGVTQRVWRTRRSARIDDLGSLSNEWSETLRELGFTTSAGVPVLIRGELWGALVVVGRGAPPTAATQDDLTSFADLAGTAISNAQARQELRSLAEEQSAFRRVAELVAHGTALDRVFSAVTAEATTLLGGVPTALRRIELDGSRTTVAAHPATVIPRPGPTAELSVPVTVEARTWGELTAPSTGTLRSGEAEGRLVQFAELAAVAIANAENKAKLTASRARVVATADETRRRLQRDVHDGAQQRLVHTIISLKLALDAAVEPSTTRDRIAEALQHAERANRELRDLVRGILPASLSHGGLRSGLESLISDIPIPVELQLTVPRLPAETETTAYFVVAEALTNVVKHARASHAVVSVDLDGATVVLCVRDDGVGGADPAAGSGLTGLADRVEAIGGVLTVTSANGTGTLLRAAFPVASPP
jgi:signal transduction histidine kinase